MYVGRIVSVARNEDGQVAALYRVSSRSFPNREAKILDDAVAILPKAGHENDIHTNPYIAYNCLQTHEQFAVVTNGSHTDYVTNKIRDGKSMRDALAEVLLIMDYERDHLNTPRIAAIVDRDSNIGYLGIVTHEHIHIEGFELAPGDAYYVATYEHTKPGSDYKDSQVRISSAEDACQYIIGQGVFADLERPITAACAFDKSGNWDIAVADAPIPEA